MDDKPPRTQKTQPRGIDKKTGKPHKPVEIPVPTRKEVFDVMRAVTGKRSVPPGRRPKQ